MGENWRERREEIIERDDRECQFCGLEEDLEVHHIRARREFKSTPRANHPANLVTLCVSCHGRLEPYSPDYQRTVLEKYGVHSPLPGVRSRKEKEYLSDGAPAPQAGGDERHRKSGRALLTDGERRAFTDETMDQNNRTSHIARVKNKLDLLGEDARILRTHAPEIYDQARAEFCDEELDERVEQLEAEVEELRDRLDEDGTHE